MPKQPAKGQSRQKFDFRLKSIYIRNLPKCGSKFLSMSLRAAFCWLQCGNERPIKRWCYEWMVTKWIKSHSTATVPFHLPLFITRFFVCRGFVWCRFAHRATPLSWCRNPLFHQHWKIYDEKNRELQPNPTQSCSCPAFVSQGHEGER